MTPKQARMWTDALRSGKYKQGRLRLRSLNNKYCCLGVLCEISGLKAVKSYQNSYLDKKQYTYDGWAGTLPPILCNKYNIKSFLPSIKVNLIEANDKQRLTFDEIADLIEIEFIYNK